MQEPRLFGMSVADNIAYGSAWASRAQVEAAASAANAHGFISSLPKVRMCTMATTTAMC